MEHYALIGNPLKHSISPILHEELFKLSGHTGIYSLIETGKLQSSEKSLRKLDGYNVTIPHKISIIPFLDHLSETALRYGAVNCVKNTSNESTGYNTDCTGFLKSLEDGKFSFAGSSVLVLGCGGVGRMMAIESAFQGAKVTIATRETSLNEARRTGSEIEYYGKNPVTVVPFEEISGTFDLVCNGTPVGMFPNPDASAISSFILRCSSYVFDAVYNPTETLFLRLGKENNAIAIGGMSMLVWQAAEAHKIWYNAAFSHDSITELISKMEKYVEENFA